MGVIATYEETRLEGRRTFHLSDHQVVVSVRSPSKDVDIPFDLAHISPAFLRMRIRPKVYGIGVALLILPWCFIVLGMISRVVTPTPELFIIPAALSIVGLAIAIVSFRKVEYAHFRTAAGITAFDIASSGKQADQFDEFVEMIVQRIQAIEAKNRVVHGEPY